MFGIQDIFFKVDVGECQKNRRCRHWNLFKILIEEKERRERLWEDSLFVRLLTHIATSEVFFLNRSPFWWISDENLGSFNRILKVVNGERKKATFPMIFSLMSRKNVSLVSWEKKSESFCSLLSKANREKNLVCRFLEENLEQKNKLFLFKRISREKQSVLPLVTWSIQRWNQGNNLIHVR